MKILQLIWIKYVRKKIIKNSIITIFNEYGPDFYIVCHIIVSEKNFFFICKKLFNYDFEEHVHAYKINDLHNFNWHVIKKEDISSAVIGHMNILIDGFSYINKTWY